MSIIIFFIYLMSLYWVFLKLDNKYDIVTKFQDKNNKKFKIIVNFLSIISFVFFIFSPIWEEYFRISGIFATLIKRISYIPLLFRWYISNRISEITRAEKEERKNRKVELTFCYHCGSDLNGYDICPSCGKEIEV